MMVTEITVRFMRRVQIKDYEPAEAEVSAKAHLEEGEDHLKAGHELIQQVREITIQGLRGPAKAEGGQTAGTTEKEVKTEKPAGKPGRKPGRKAAADKAAEKPAGDELPDDDGPKADAKPAAKPAATDGDELPDDDGPKADAKPAAEPAAAAEEVPDGGEDVDGELAELNAALSADDLQKHITDMVAGKNEQKKKLPVAKVKEILAKHGAGRTSEVKPEDREKVRDEITAAVQ